MALTTQEKTSFTKAKLDQLARFPDAKLESLLDLGGEQSHTQEEKDSFRAKVLGNWAALDEDQIKCRVNIDSLSGKSVNFSQENDYAASDQRNIEEYAKDGATNWGTELPRLLKQRKIMGGLIDDATWATIDTPTAENLKTFLETVLKRV